MFCWWFIHTNKNRSNFQSGDVLNDIVNHGFTSFSKSVDHLLDFSQRSKSPNCRNLIETLEILKCLPGCVDFNQIKINREEFNVYT